jgi:hypothetical protein
MRVAAHELLVDVVGDVGERSRSALLEQQRQEVHLEEDVAELVEQLGVVAVVSGLGELVGLLDVWGTIERSSCSRSHGQSRRSRRVSASSRATASATSVIAARLDGRARWLLGHHAGPFDQFAGGCCGCCCAGVGVAFGAPLQTVVT